MKKTNLLTLALIGCIGFWSSCSKDNHDHADECDFCHIAIKASDGQTDSLVWHIEDENGEILFCNEDLHATEDSYTIPAGQFLVEQTGLGDTLVEGTVITHLVDGYEIHCHDSK